MLQYFHLVSTIIPRGSRGAVLALAMAASMPVPHGVAAQSLTKEADLAGIYESKILNFWNSRGKRRDFSGIDGVRIASMVFARPDSTEGIVILNGYGESFIKYREIVYDLWQAGYQVYILDHRGQGFSERLIKPNKKQQADPTVVKSLHDLGHVERFDDYVIDLKTFVEKIAKPSNARLYLVAHSMGGTIGSLYLEKYAKDFSAVALSSPMHEPNLSPVPNSLCWLLRLGPRNKYVWGRGPYMEHGDFNPDRDFTSSQTRYEILKRRELKYSPEAQLGGPSFNWAYQSCKASRQSVQNAYRIKTPVLLFQASNDRLVKPGGQKQFCDAVNSSRRGSCRMELIGGARHELLIESDQYRNAILNKIIRFFKKQGGRANRPASTMTP
ncbi:MULTISPECIES: alpha/beta fold hydrolase [unclassified Phyllobacterium]|uniref:alpha/beta fold hydrolase n=1 Tax=unclassified Phyllobacterium TaxID=2638441 RepID=UPI0030131683